MRCLATLDGSDGIGMTRTSPPHPAMERDSLVLAVSKVLSPGANRGDGDGLVLSRREAVLGRNAWIVSEIVLAFLAAVTTTSLATG